MNLEQEKEILESLQDTPDRFGEIFDAYYDTIFQYTLKRVENTDIAFDIASETFLKAIRNIKKYHFQGVSILHWFYRIASNEIALFYRKGKYVSSSLDQLTELQGYEPVSDADIEKEYQAFESQLELIQDFQNARKELLSLPLKYQEVISLKYLEEKSIKEISSILQKSEGTIKSLISRGTAKIKKNIISKNLQPKFY